MHSILTGNKLERFEKLCEAAAKMTDPERGRKKNPKAVVSVVFVDGYARDMSLEMTEKVAFQEELK